MIRYPDLQRLSLSMLPEISDASLGSVAWHCRSLTSLALSHCPRISDHGIARAAPHLSRLQHLYLSCCDAVTDRSDWTCDRDPKVDAVHRIHTVYRRYLYINRYCYWIQILDMEI